MAHSFFKEVYEVVQQIPKGNVATYGLMIAKLIGTRDARRVGHALHANTDHATPCHRVVFADGSLASGYVFGGPQKQRERLEQEGVTFLENGYVDLKVHIWDPRF